MKKLISRLAGMSMLIGVRQATVIGAFDPSRTNRGDAIWKQVLRTITFVLFFMVVAMSSIHSAHSLREILAVWMFSIRPS